MKSKQILLFFIGLISFIGTSQKDSIMKKSNFSTISVYELNVLYRNYPNKINYVSNHNYDSIWIQSKNAQLTIIDDYNAIIYPDEKRQCTISFHALDNRDTIDLEVYQFRVVNLPNPTIYFGSIPLEKDTLLSNDFSLFTINRFFAKYPPEIPLSACFEIKEWVIQINGKEYKGEGSNISNEVKNILFKAKKNSSIVFKSFKIKGMGIERTIYPNSIYLKKNKRKTIFEEKKIDSECTG